MKLISSPLSPFVRKVRVLIHETSLSHLVTEEQVATTALDPAAQAVTANPLAKIPALVRDDGPSLFDSRVICRYLDDYAGASLYPPSRLWEMLTLEALVDGIMEAAVLMSYEARLRPESERSPAWVEAQWGKVARGLDALEAHWMSHLSGPLNIGQIGAGCALSYIDFRHDARGWRDGRAALAEWHKVFAARDSMIATAPEG